MGCCQYRFFRCSLFGKGIVAIIARTFRKGIRELAPFCEQLVTWAFGHYEEATALFMLKKLWFLSQ